MKKLLVLILAILLVSSVAVLADTPDENYELLFADEFDKEINLDVWKYRTGPRLGGYNYPENVYIKDGRMYHVMRYDTKNGEEQLTGGGIISNNFFGYGYYETKCTLSGKTGGMHSSFWSMGFGGDGEKYPKYNQVYEIDGYEIDSHKKERVTCNLNLYIGGHRGYGYAPVTDFPTDREFVFGYEWLPNEINWYLNGKLIQTKKGDEIPIHYAQQNLWITGLANADISGVIERDKLPDEASWDYVRFYAMPLKNINLLGSSEFEYNTNPEYSTNIDNQYPMSWMESGDIEASLIERNKNAMSGNNVLAHRYNKAYKVTTSQRLYYIPNGNYNFEVYAMSSGGQKTAKIRISDFDGDKIIEKDIPQSDKMKKISIDGIEIKDNGAYIEFISDASKKEWVLFDNPSLYSTDGKEVEKAIPYTTDMSDVSLGEYVVSKNDKGYSQNGDWIGSGVAGFKNAKSVFAYATNDASATFELIAPKSGKFYVCFYKVIHQNSSTAARVCYEYKGEVSEKKVNLTADSGWEKLGVVNLKKGEKITVTVDNKYGGLIRASAAALIPTSSVTMQDVLILKINNKNVWAKGKKVSVDENNFEIVPKIMNSRTMVPIRFIAENFGADVSYIEETREIVIKSGEYEVVLTVDSDIMKLNGNNIKLDASACLENGRTLVPVRAISEGLNKKVTYIPEGYVIIGEQDYDVNDELTGYIEELYN